MHNHVAVQGDGVTGAGKIRERDPIRRRGPALGGERGGFDLRAQEVLEPAPRNPGRVRHHHDVVQRYGVVMPLVDRLGRIGRLEVQVTELHGHRMRGDAGAVDVAHRLRDLRADVQIPQPARSVAAAPDDVLDTIAGAYRPPSQAPGGVQHDLGARVGKHPEWRRSPDRGGRRFDLGLAVAKVGQADHACRRLDRQVLVRIEGDFVREPLVTDRTFFRKWHRDVHPRMIPCCLCAVISWWGLAKATELDGMPGPIHLLELKDAIPLTPEQVEAITAIYARMRAAAIAEGERFITAEQALEDAFRDRTVTEESLRTMLGEIGTSRFAQ